MDDEPTGLSSAQREAHEAWLARGRTGDGRLSLRDATIRGSLAGADLRYADLESCTFDGAEMTGAKLDGARLLRCSFVGADLRRASAVDARFERCDLRRASVAGMRVDRSRFLACAFGDFGSQPIGKPEVFAPYIVLAPDLSHLGDGSRVGHAHDVDARWYSPPTSPDGRARTRRVVFDGIDGHRYVATALHMHMQFAREAGPRFQDRTAFQTFRQLLAEGPPSPYRDAMPRGAADQVRALATTLAAEWSVDPT